MKFLCSHWPPEVWRPWTSSSSSFSRSSLQPLPGAACLWVSLPTFVSSVIEKLLCWLVVSWLIHCFAHEEVWVFVTVFLRSFSICTVGVSFVAAGWMWATGIVLNPFEFILLLQSAVTSSENTSVLVPLATKHAHVVTLPPPGLTCDWTMSCSFSRLFSSHHSDTSLFWFQLSKQSDFRTWEAF